MYCLKCGRETGGTQVFCEACLDVMGRYPVKQDVAILLPQRSTASLTKRASPRKRPLSLEERFAKLKKINRLLIGVVILLSLALSLSAVSLAHQNDQLQFTRQVGKNYTIDTTAD